jgi:hypothetical protein
MGLLVVPPTLPHLDGVQECPIVDTDVTEPDAPC